MAAKGLGQGLDALLGGGPVSGDGLLPVTKIEPRPDQPRQRFDQEALEELAASIAEHGVVQPVVVRPIDKGFYQIVAGERRWRAARMAGLFEVPVHIIEADDKTAAELALVENLQRENLDPIEEAEGYRSLRDKYGMTQEQIASRVAKSRPVIANALRLLALPEDVRGYLQTGALSPSIARLLLELDGDPVRSTAAEEIVTKQLTVREAQALVKRLKRPPRPEKTPIEEIDYTAEAEKALTHALGRKVRITGTSKKGRIEPDFYGPEDRENLISALRRLNKMKE